MPQSIEEWYQTMPPITKAYFLAAVGSTVFCAASVVSPFSLYLDFDMIVGKLEIWRLVTCFTYFGKFSMGFVFQMFMLTNYCRSLESEVFPGKAGMAEMSFMLLFGAVLMWIVSYLMVLPFLGTSMLFFIIYIWSRKQPQRPVSLWGFGLKGWQLPFALMVIGLLMGGSPVMDIIGLLCGHCFHFLTDIVPLAYGRQVLVCPQFLYGLFDRDARPARPAFAGQGNRLS